MIISTTNNSEIQNFISSNVAWSLKQNKLHREYIFANFIEAFGFMTQIALIAEKNNHHPEWFNVYKTVIVDLTTHEAGGISDKDFSLATKMESLFIDHYS